MKFKFFGFLFLFLYAFVNPVLAVSDPRSVPNNIVGINSLSPESEIADVASLVNNGGDWGYVVIVIRKDERDLKRWQSFLDQARKQHLIPVIRLATMIDKKGFWEHPGENDVQEWADFLSKLYFPTKNRYVQVYNEVNVSGEWGGEVNAADYARELDKTIDAFKEKSGDFFILNAPLDLSLTTSKTSLETSEFFQKMEDAVPGIFKKLDGWASHSYPNPDFSAPPSESGKTSIEGFIWELDQIDTYIAGKDLPVFITETGWKRDKNGLTEDEIANYYKEAFANAWNDERIVAVTPFVLNYPEPLFDQFSFKNSTENSAHTYYEHFFAIRDLPKVKGEPRRENLISELKINRPSVVLKDFENVIRFRFKNEGNYVWDTKKDLAIKVISANLSVRKPSWSKEEVYPGQEVTATLKIQGIDRGTVPLRLQIVHGGQILAESKSELTVDTPFSLFIKRIKALWSHLRLDVFGRFL